MTTINLQIQELQQNQSTRRKKKTPRYIIIALLKTSNKEKVLKQPEKGHTLKKKKKLG